MLTDRPTRTAALAALLGAGLMAACSVINAPEDPVEPSTGSGMPGGTGGAAGSGGGGSSPCPPDEVFCGNTCIDPLTNSEHCGASGDCENENAGMVCPPGIPCEDGECGKPINPEGFPVEIPGTAGGYSDLALDPDGHLLVPTQNGRSLIRISRFDADQDTLVAGIGDAGSVLVAVAYDFFRDQVFVGGADASGGPVFQVDVGNGSWEQIATLEAPHRITSLAVAPEPYEPYGGHVIASTSGGDIVAINPDEPTEIELITTLLPWVGDLAFAADGTLYAAGHAVADPAVHVQTVAPDGTAEVFATGFESPDGLWVDELGSRLFVADSGAGTLYAVSIPGGELTVMANEVDFNVGYYASGLAFDGAQTLVMSTGESETVLTIEAMTIPLPAQ